MPIALTEKPRVFLVTGCSTGFGRNLAQEVIDRGDICVATARKVATIEVEDATSKNFLALRLDVTKPETIIEAFDQAVKTFGRVDAFVNNAGNGLSGTFESLSETDIVMQMNVNFFGVLSSTRKCMEVMRTQSPPGGVIQQVTSIGGLCGMPLMSLYSASKFAVEGFTEAVSQELKPEWGIHFTLIEPGGFKTDFFPRSMTYTDSGHPAYDHIDLRKSMKELEVAQNGDPKKAAKVMYDMATLSSPPSRLLLGSDALGWYKSKLEQASKDVDANKDITVSTDFDSA